MATTKLRPLALARIRQLTGVPFVDGSAVVSRYSLTPLLSVDASEARTASPQHDDMRLAAQRLLAARGCPVTDTHIGLNGHEGVYQFADFAAEVNGKIVLVECLTWWWGTKDVIVSKLRLDPYATLWFVAQPRSFRSLTARGFRYYFLKPIVPGHYEGCSKIAIAWKDIKVPRVDPKLPRLRAFYARTKRRAT